MNGLTVLNPFFLSLLPLAVAPILFHLFFRMKKKPRSFPSLMFFMRIDPKLNARRRLREWLVLLLRMLLIAFLLVALARPVLRGVGREGTIAAVLLLDNSGSMSARSGGEITKLKEATAAAHAFVSPLREKDTAGVILLVDDPLVPLPNGLVSDKAALKEALERIGETEATGSPTRALERAMAWLEGSSATRFEIHIFSDLQENEWNVPPLNLSAPRQGTSLFVHRVPSPASRKPNLSLGAVQLTDRKVLAGRRVPLQIRLSNPTGFEGNARLNWLDDAGNRHAQEISISPRADKSVVVSLEPAQPGLRWVVAWLEGDEFQADNRATLAFRCDEKKVVLFLGRGEEFGLLPTALSPSGDGKRSGLVPVLSEPAAMLKGLEERKPACLAITAQELSRIAASPDRSLALRQFVERGGHLLVMPAAGRLASLAALPDWIALRYESWQTNSAGWPLMVFNKSADVFTDLRDERGEVALRNLRAFQICPLRVGSAETPLLGLEDGRVLLVEKRLGRGKIFVSGLPFDSASSTLPLKAGFLALAQSLALVAADAGQDLVSLVAGEPWTSTAKSSETVEVETLTGSPLHWKGGGQALTGLPRSGVYSVRSGRELTCVSVRSSEKEGLPRFLNGDQVPALGRLPYSVRTLAGGDSFSSADMTLERSRDLALPFLLLALLVWLLEGWLANPAPVMAKRAAVPVPSVALTPKPRSVVA